MFLPYVVAYNEATAKEQLAPLAELFPGTSIAHGLQRFAHSLGAPRSLCSLALEEGSIIQVAREAATNAYSNPRPLEEATIKLLLQDAYIGHDIGQ